MEGYNNLVYGGLHLTNGYLLSLNYKRPEIQKYLIKKLKNYYDKEKRKFLYHEIPDEILNKKISKNIKFTLYDIVYLHAATFYHVYTDKESELFEDTWLHIIESFLFFSVLEKVANEFGKEINLPEASKNYIETLENLLICILNILEHGDMRFIYQKYPVDIDYTLENNFEFTRSDNFEEDIYGNLYNFEKEKNSHKNLFDYYESDFSNYADKIIKNSLKNPNCHKICVDVYAYANEFAEEIFWNDDATKINLYKEYKEKSDKHKHLLEGVIGEVLYKNAIVEMGLENSLNKIEEKDNLKDQTESSKKSVENFEDEITLLASLKIENNKLSPQQIEQILKTFAEKQGIETPSKYSISKFIENI